VKTTGYFRDHILRKRPYLRLEWCEDVLRAPEQAVQQVDGRWPYWKFIPELGKVLRVVTLEDGDTVLNAFPDRNFKGGER
jgi:hypothetical protein